MNLRRGFISGRGSTPSSRTYRDPGGAVKRKLVLVHGTTSPCASLRSSSTSGAGLIVQVLLLLESSVSSKFLRNFSVDRQEDKPIVNRINSFS